MRFGSVCSGIEAASVAWHPLGWQAAWLAEIEPFPSAVLAHHYPDVPNLGDMTALPKLLNTGLLEAPDVLCGGTPCQAFSVAGMRKSLDDARGNLSLTFCEIANAIDEQRISAGLAPAIIFWENVPGVLNTHDNAFGCFLGALAGESGALVPPGGKWSDAGYVYGPQRTIAWRTLDAQYFGLAQRRKRVFVVASARAGFDPAAVLFEFDGVRRDSAPGRETGESVAGTIAKCSFSDGASGKPEGAAVNHFVGVEIGSGGGKFTDLNPTLDARCKDGPIRNQLAGAVVQKVWPADVASTLDTHYGDKQGLEYQHVNAGCPLFVSAVAHTIDEEKNANVDMCGTFRVRRLTPVECERLQGFPDGHTDIKPKGKPTPDGPRYKALGNSWAVPVVRWIGERIDEAIKC